MKQLDPLVLNLPYNNAFYQVQTLLWACKEPLYIGHNRAHSGLPGPLAQGNCTPDSATPDPHVFNIVEESINFHKDFHVNATTLKIKYNITKEQARNIVKQCPACVPHLPVPHFGVNSRGPLPNHLWQMYVTHFPKFGTLRFVPLYNCGYLLRIYICYHPYRGKDKRCNQSLP